MKKISVGIIGGTHGMGQWLAEVLTAEGCNVCVTGRNTPMTAADAASTCDIVVVSVPIAATADVIGQVGPLMKKKQLLMDLTSLKKEPIALMLSSSVSEVVGCHPLFGPSITQAAGNNIVLCPGRGKTWYDWIKNIFLSSGYTLLERTPSEHDRMVAIVQALNHLNTIALGSVIARTGYAPDEIHRYATPVFRTKMEMIQKVFTESPDLFAQIIAGNPDTDDLLETYQQVIAEIRRLLKTGGSAALKDYLTEAACKLF